MKNRQRRILLVYGIISMLTVTGFLVRALVHFPQIHITSADNIRMTFVSFIYLMLIWEGNNLIYHRLNQFFPFEKNIPVRIIIQLFIAGAFMILLRFIVLRLFKNTIPDFVKRDSIVLKIVYFIDFIIAVSIHLAYISNYFFNQWKISFKRAERLEKEKAQVQFDNLRNHLNPHFLFNNLTLLDGLIHEDPELASRFLQQMSRVYRYILQHKDKELVSLDTEIAIVKYYIELLKTRYESGLEINITLSETALEKKIVPVTLQNLIENALKHNIVSADKPLHIHISDEPDYLVMKNNIQLKKKVETSNNQGLHNLKALYFYLSRHPIVVMDDEREFTVKVPLVEV